MDAFANALAQAVQDLKNAEALCATVEQQHRDVCKAMEEAHQNRQELEELVEILTARVTGEPRKGVPL